jgi:hypothetical protein
MRLSTRFVTSALALLLAGPASAAEPEILRTSWTGFRQEVAARTLNGRSVQVTLAGGKVTNTKLREVTDTGLVVGDHTTIARDQVTSVRFRGRRGKGRLIGTLVGLGAGAGIAAAVTTGRGVTEGPVAILIPAAGAATVVLGGLTGYLIGRSLDRTSLEFVLTAP